MPEKEQQKELPWWHESLTIFFKVSSWIAGPILIALFLGQFLDRKWGTEPWVFLGCTGIAFIFSCFGIVRETMKYMKRISEEAEAKKNQ